MRIVDITVELLDVQPPVTRRLQVPDGVTLAQLHTVLQVAMGWTDAHLHEFEVDGVRYGPPDPDEDDEVRDESRVRLATIVGPGDGLDYVYDFGDGWTHRLTVEGIVDEEPGVGYPRCVSGQRACPPEDVGGPPGYEEFLAALADPAHPEHAEYREWAGDRFDPAFFDLDAVNSALASLARRGRGRHGAGPARLR